jgi:hypothetical protein
LKFSDVIMAAALLFVVGIVLTGVLFVPFVSLESLMSLVAGIIAGLIVSIIVGYLFAVQIREESRLRAIGTIVLLATAGVLIFAVGWFANPLASPAIYDAMRSMFNTSMWTAYDWFAYTAVVMALNIAVFVVASFVGLYVGSMLKPKKT